LGCKVNQYDTQLVREALLRAGFRETGTQEPAELCIVNTCTVTHQADAEGRTLIRRVARENPGAKIVVMGCYAARDPAALHGLPGVAAVIEHHDRIGEVLGQFGVERLPRGITRFEGHHRAFVKVQDGCLLNCTFCIIPQVRPSLRSRPPQDVEVEIAGLVRAGYREVVLSGIHLGHYGVDTSRGRARADQFRLWHLIRRLAQIPGDWRLRLSSLEATEVTDEFVDLLAAEPRVCPHLHLCLQSGSDRILTAMKRRYRVAGFLRRLETIRQRLDQAAFTTDVIVGFPGETERDFADTLAACETAGFSKIHIFPFSARGGTAAATMPQQVRAETIRERRSRLAALESRLAARYHQSLVGRRLDVLVERAAEGDPPRSRGTACRYVPVEFSARPGEQGQLLSVRVVAATETGVVGQRDAAAPQACVGTEPLGGASSVATFFGSHPLPVLDTESRPASQKDCLCRQEARCPTAAGDDSCLIAS
jgi:threonylcarbamoyladenosine tRNA methylthiotransferase MtaB